MTGTVTQQDGNLVEVSVPSARTASVTTWSAR